MIKGFFKLWFYFFCFCGLIMVAYYASMVLPFILALLLALVAFRCYKQKDLQAVTSCPYCGNDTLDVSTLHTQTNYTRNTVGQSQYRSGLFNGTGNWNSSTSGRRNYIYAHEARCTKCGNLFPYITQDEINNIKLKNLVLLIMCTVMLVVSIPISIKSIRHEKSVVKEKNSAMYNYLWQVEPSPIEDFEYKLNKNDNTIILREYKRDSSSSYKKVHIASSYEVDGVTYDVVELDDVDLGYTGRKSVILGDGIRHVNEDLFNGGSDIKAVYLPSSLENIGPEFFSYFNKNLDDIYFSGSEEDFNRIFGSSSKNTYLTHTLIHYDYSLEQLFADAPIDETE